MSLGIIIALLSFFPGIRTSYAPIYAQPRRDLLENRRRWTKPVKQEPEKQYFLNKALKKTLVLFLWRLLVGLQIACSVGMFIPDIVKAYGLENLLKTFFLLSFIERMYIMFFFQ